MNENVNIALVRRMWTAYEREGLEGILPFASRDAEWRPYSADGKVFLGTDRYREFVREMLKRGERVDATLVEVQAHGDCVVVTGRLRIRGEQGMRDNPMHWVHRVANGQIVFTASHVELNAVLDAAGLRLDSGAAA